MSPLPLLDRRGGCAKKRILRSNHCRHRRGGCSNSNKTFEQPPRPLLVDASRLLLMSRPPLLSRRGNGAHPNSFTPSMTAHNHSSKLWAVIDRPYSRTELVQWSSHAEAAQATRIGCR